MRYFQRIRFVLLSLATLLLPGQLAFALPAVTEIDFQPVGVQIQRLQEALEYLGEPLPDEITASL
ncbi:MAG: hypothetical protein ACR2NM_10495, partial [Bythopirellula sp.]